MATSSSSSSPVVSGAETLLDKSLLGYSKLGPALRKRWWPADPPAGSLQGRRVLVTGATSGIGTAIAVGLARLDATVHLLGRDRGRTDDTRDEVSQQVPGSDLVTEVCDVSDLDAVRAFASDFTGRVEQLHAVVHNAGVMPPERTESEQGHELSFATHVLGPYLLTVLLRPALAADGDARVIWMSSGGMYGEQLDASDLQYTKGEYKPVTAYARTKRMQVVIAEELAGRLEAISVHSMHPGWADTPGVASSLPTFRKLTGPLLRDPAAGADTAVWLAAAPEGGSSTGLFWHDRRPRPTSFTPRGSEPAGERDKLWAAVTEMTGESPS